MVQGKPREMRQAVRLAARLRDGGGWHSVTICNLSSRGMMLECASPVAKHSFVEIRCRNLTVAGQIRWSNGTRCGVRTQDRIDVAGLLSGPERQGQHGGYGPSARRPAAPVQESAAIARQVAGMRWARAIDWLAVAAAGTVFAALAARGVSSAFSAPMAAVKAALRAPQ